jgi:hypothetical protein
MVVRSGVEVNGFSEDIPSPVEVMLNSMHSLKVYSEALDRLGAVDVDLQFGVLEGVMPEVEVEIDKRTRYSQMIAEQFFGANVEGAVAEMNYWDILRIAHRMKKEANITALLGEARDVSGVVSGFFQKSRRKTIGKLEKHSEELDEVETVAVVAARVSRVDEPLVSGPYTEPEDPESVLKAVKILNGATKHTYPGEADFDIMHELLAVSGTLVLSQAARYLHLAARIKLVEGLFRHNCDPVVIKNIFEKGQNWHIFMQSLRAPKTLVGLLKEHQTAYTDIAKAKVKTAAITNRVTGLHGLLREIASQGVARHMERAVGALSELLQKDTTAPSISDDQVKYLFSRLRYVDDEDAMINLGVRLEQLLVAA